VRIKKKKSIIHRDTNDYKVQGYFMILNCLLHPLPTKVVILSYRHNKVQSLLLLVMQYMVLFASKHASKKSNSYIPHYGLIAKFFEDNTVYIYIY
jgi:hypothetical protein